jgi:hypothetical protein
LKRYFENRKAISMDENYKFPQSLVETPAQLFSDSFSKTLSVIPRIILKSELNLQKERVN